MALVDPYAPCPCGSDKKFKWCCQKVEPYVERAQRLLENGQNEAAVAVLSEGLAKVPDNPWLLLRQAMIHVAQKKLEEAKQAVAAVLRKQPDHLGAAALYTRLLLVTDGPVPAAAQLQRALNHMTDDARPGLSKLTADVAMGMSRSQLFPAAMKHLELALAMGTEEAEQVKAQIHSLRADAAISPWFKGAFKLFEAPETMREPQQEQFDDALDWADDGLWGAAASTFELLSADPEGGAAADHNLGLCRLWLGEEQAAVMALRRWIPRGGKGTYVADLAVLCQILEEPADPEPAELVKLSWQIRDRSALLRALSADPEVVGGEDRRFDLEDERSPQSPAFQLLDRPRITARIGLNRQDVPMVLGEILVGPETVAIETADDGRLNAVIDRFTALAGKAIPPAHPRTKVIGHASRSDLALSWHWYLPAGLPEEEQRRLHREQIAYVMARVWPDTPLDILDGMTPRQAARSDRFQMRLRAALLQMQLTADELWEAVDWTALRERLGIEQEPPIDPLTVTIDEVPPARLGLAPMRELDDERLVAFYLRARAWGQGGLAVRAARAIAERPELAERMEVPALWLYGDLAVDAFRDGNRDAALVWINRGRAAGQKGRRNESAPDWDLLELRFRSALDDPKDWVPDLAAVLQRYQDNGPAMSVVTARLIEMGLIRLSPVPDRPNEVQLDTRPLQLLLRSYGPRIASSAGFLGVSATKGEIWTPETASAGSGSAIWTPGSEVGGAAAGAGAGAKPRIIVPGQ